MYESKMRNRIRYALQTLLHGIPPDPGPPPSPYGTTSYSQEGEDRVLNRLFEGQSTGFYIDVGAFHPMRFSNTYLLYLRGWRGINIDPRLGTKEEFDRDRPRDINIQSAIDLEPGTLDYFEYAESAYNTCDRELVDTRNIPFTSVRQVEAKPLADVLDANLPIGVSIDFISIDAEGLDLRVLQSNDWDRYRPNYVLVEIIGKKSLENVLNHEITEFLTRENYVAFAKTYNTIFYISRAR